MMHQADDAIPKGFFLKLWWKCFAVNDCLESDVHAYDQMLNFPCYDIINDDELAPVGAVPANVKKLPLSRLTDKIELDHIAP